MKKSKVIFLTLLACAYGALAESTTSSDAELVARGWSRLNASAFGSLGEVQAVTAEKDANGDVLWYVVKMDKGAAIVSPDDEIEPVIAVLPNSDGTLGANDTLRAMLMLDLPQRIAKVRTASGGLPVLTLGTAAASASTSKEASKWRKLKDCGGNGLWLGTVAGGGTPATVVRWLDGWNSADTKKVGDTKVQTLRFWNQNRSSDYFSNENIFDLYTPGHAPCGCVATAGASIMHYFRVPSGNAGLERACSYNDAPMTLTTKGGEYDWSLVDGLELVNGSSILLTDAAVDLLARVAYDCGVGCKMMYGDEGSGTYTSELMRSFREVFNVQNAQYVRGSGDIGKENYANLIYNQIRGGAPVAMGIKGHEVVACGYGYDANATDYTFVFLGWGSSNDAWYALPNIDTKATVEGGWYTSTFVDELVTEIAPADDKFVAVVGRLVDADGEPIAGDTITMSNGEVLTSDENGYWGTRVSPADPCYVLDSLGEAHEYEIGELAQTTSASSLAAKPLAAAMPEAMTVELLDPSVRVDGVEYGSLTRALEAVQEGQTVEIFKPTIFKKSVTVSVSCTIYATTADPFENAVSHRNAAQITVADGATVTMTNVVMKTSEGTKTVVVEDGGVLQIGGVCMVEAVATHDADNLVLIDALPEGCTILVDCETAQNAGETFAQSALPLAESQAFATRLLRYAYDQTNFGGEAYAGVGESVVFRWLEGASVPRERAYGQLNGVNYRSLTELLAAYDEAVPSEIVVFRDAAFPSCLTLGTSLMIRGEAAVRPVLTMTEMSGERRFAIGAGGSLTVSNVVFRGYEPASGDWANHGFAWVDGGSLTLADGAVLSNITGRASKRGSGVIDLRSGTVTMLSGSLITGCRSTKSYDGGGGYGGAIYTYYSNDCTLNLKGGTITRCWAAVDGGGVYVDDSNGKSATVNISGDTIIADNTSGGGKCDDLCMTTVRALPHIRLAGALSGRVGVRYATKVNGMETGNAEGESFMMNAAGVTKKDTATLYRLFCDANDKLVGAVGADGKLVWAQDPRDPRQCDTREEAAARLTDATGDVTYWRQVSGALEAATDGSTVEVIAHDGFVPLTNGVALVGKCVTLCSEAGVTPASKLLRSQNAQISICEGAELLVTNVEIFGCDTNAEDQTVHAVTLFDVNGGKLTVSDAVIRDNIADGQRNANAITVYGGGELEMSDVFIEGCCNLTEDFSGVKDTNAGAGGAILVDGAKGGATARFRGLNIGQCQATWGGGVYACNGATVYVSGATTIYGNSLTDGLTFSNLQMSDGCELIVDGALTGSIGVTPLVYSLQQHDTNRIARVDYEWNFTSLTNSAARFERDADGARGVAVTNKTQALIVWCDAVKDGVYVDTEGGNSVSYALAGVIPPYAPRETILPALPASADVRDVSVALAVSGLADETAAAKILASEDPVEAYGKFREWATGIPGGVKAVADSEYAGASYALGTQTLLTHEPDIRIGSVKNAEGGLSVSVSVMDGGTPVDVTSEMVAKLFEATSDVTDWSKQVPLTVVDLTLGAAKVVSFTVTPPADCPAAFVRLVY